MSDATSRAPFDWFPPHAVAELAARIARADPETCRLEIRRHGDKTFLRVCDQRGKVHGNRRIEAAALTATLQAAGIDDDDIDESRLCPPICP